jgi:hypothetical protein
MYVTVEQHRHTANGTKAVRTLNLEVQDFAVIGKTPLVWVRYPQHGIISFSLAHGWTEKEADMPLWRIAQRDLAILQERAENEKGIRILPTEIDRGQLVAMRNMPRVSARRAPPVDKRQRSLF